MEAQPGRDELIEIGRLFEIPGRLESHSAFGSGHIHRTLLAAYLDRGRTVRYLHQNINERVFSDPAALMENIVRVLDHLRGKAAPRRVPTLVPARRGGSWARDGKGGAWRTWVFIEGSRSFDAPQNPRMAREAARAFGTFQRDLLDLPGPPLHETIPGFHDTRARFETFRGALAADRLARAASVEVEIEFALAREQLADVLETLRAEGLVEGRIVHNDTKLSNVLFDAAGEALAVVDLDTVMPGLSLHDFGDLVRTASHRAAEDDAHATRVDGDLFRGLARGWLESLDGVLTPAERDSLVLAGRVIAYECGLRFLTDHLDGDRYFGARSEGHNAARCRAQFALVRSLEENERALEGLLRS